MLQTLDKTLMGGGNLAATPGSEQWAIAVRLHLQHHLKEHHANVEHLEVMLRGMIEEQGWRHLSAQSGRPFTSFEQFSREREPWGLGYDPHTIDEIIRERKTAAALAEKAKPLAKNGAIGKGRGRDSSNVVIAKQGNSADYLAARIKRDRPDILEKMKAGEYKSVRAAARDAGIVKEQTNAEKIRRLYLRLSEGEREAFLEWVSNL